MMTHFWSMANLGGGGARFGSLTVVEMQHYKKCMGYKLLFSTARSCNYK